MKIVYSDPKTGKTAQMELSKDRSALVLNYKIGDVIDGAAVGLSGFKLKITGGSDNSGFPLDRSIQGTIKTRTKRIGASGRLQGVPKMQTVRGNMISTDVEQVNTIIVEYGDKNLDELFPKSEKQKEKPEEEKASAKK
jgi:small subunit ribosomal protein S6e